MSNNPLRQYFRRPALYITLPSKGKYYPEGTLEMPDNGELPVYPMTAIDEITAKTPDALFNGNAVIEIIKSCVPSIKDPWVLPSVDVDTLLIAIRAATNGNDLEIDSFCPKCEESGKYGVNLVSLLSDIKAEGYENVMKIRDLEIKFRPLSYRDVNNGNLAQFEIKREINNIQLIEDDDARAKQSAATMKKLTEMNIEIVVNTIESIKLPNTIVDNKEYISEFLHGCDRNTFSAIRDQVIKLREGANIKPMKIKCVNCSHDYEQSLALNVSDFFD
jgi:hypothetical protein